MGVQTFESEIKTPVAPAKLFKALALDADNLLQKVLPDNFKASEILEGDGGPGTIKKITISDGSVTRCMKHKIEAIDEGSLSYKYSVVEGDMLMEKVERIEYESKIEESGDGGSIFKNKSTYYTKGDYVLQEEEMKEGKQKAGGIFKAIEAYLLANPHY